MPQWATFAGLTVLSILLFLSLARLSQSAVNETDGESVASCSTTDSGHGPESTNRSESAADSPSDRAIPPWRVGDRARTDGTLPPRSTSADAAPGSRSPASIESFSTGALLLNVAFSQGLFGGIVLLGAWYAEVPLGALGIGAFDFGVVLVGVGLGLGLYAGNELATTGAETLGFTAPETLRATLAPDSAVGWVVLFVLVLPMIAFVEELLFRAALVGAISAGFAISPWPLAVLSSVAFGFGHGAQGSVGMVITGLLGFLLAAAFVLTGSFLVVVIAHYLVNAAEFAVREGFDVDDGPFA